MDVTRPDLEILNIILYLNIYFFENILQHGTKLLNTEKDLNIYKKKVDLNTKDYWVKTSIINL